ncbi:DUF4296 domain-containing protein [bacterium]|nr:MAG: DUF4296 domain-containing protein [bacterium]
MKLPYVRLFLLNILLFGLISCEDKSDRKPENLIEPVTFVKLLAEFQIMNTAINVEQDSAMAKTMRDSVLKYYDIELEQFYSSEKYYAKDGKEYQRMLNMAMDLLSEEQAIHIDKNKN